MEPSPATAAATPKGASTRGVLLDRAAEMASRLGLEGVTIGELAAAAGMSKSGVFAHFGSREDLVRQTLDWVAGQFVDAVFLPSLRQPRGLPRLQAIMAAWIEWIGAHPDGCVFLGASVEYDGRPGPMREHVASLAGRWHQALEHATAMAVGEGHLAADTEPPLVAFQLQALMDGLHHARLYRAADATALARRAVAELFSRHAVTAHA
ncbi:TetR/AcrR family transcriptional regulator [Pseudoxanthomonas koreensis]|uniref:TetR/AcrR family transcriptional regulator n=1 Tax=Pseudoxanthomonas koreensis TaxID=266061 RepID=UPI0035A6E220